MRQSAIALLLGALFVSLIAVGGAARHDLSAVHAQSGCTNGTLTGTYGFTQTGFFTFSEKGGGGYAPTADVGSLTFDGLGNFSASFTDSTNGKITTGLSAPGMYTVNSDCSGNLTIENPTSPGESAPYTFVLVQGGNELRAIATTAESTQTVTAKKEW
jgi:hypothetical protein